MKREEGLLKDDAEKLASYIESLRTSHEEEKKQNELEVVVTKRRTSRLPQIEEKERKVEGAKKSEESKEYENAVKRVRKPQSSGILAEMQPKEKVFRSRLAEGDTGKIPKLRREDVTGKLPKIEKKMEKRLEQELEVERQKDLARKQKLAEISSRKQDSELGEEIFPAPELDAPYVESVEEVELIVPTSKLKKTLDSTTGKIPVGLQNLKEITVKLPKVKIEVKTEIKVGNSTEEEDSEMEEGMSEGMEKSEKAVRSRVAEGDTGKIPLVLREDLSGVYSEEAGEVKEVSKPRLEELEEGWADEPYKETAFAPTLVKSGRGAKSRLAEGDTGKIPEILREDVTGRIPKTDFEEEVLEEEVMRRPRTSMEEEKPVKKWKRRGTEDRDEVSSDGLEVLEGNDVLEEDGVSSAVAEREGKRSSVAERKKKKSSSVVAEETRSSVAVAEREEEYSEHLSAETEEVTYDDSQFFQEDEEENYEESYEEGYGDEYAEGGVAVASSTVTAPSRRRVQEEKKKSKVFPLVFGGIATVIALVGGYLIHSVLDEVRQEEEVPVPEISIAADEGNYIDYLGMKYPVFADVPVNEYDGRGFFSDENGYIRYEVDGLSGIPGLDVSYHQQSIDWTQVAEAGFEFAMIRAGRRGYGEEGSLAVDTEFDANMRGATENGMDVGVYFFSQATNMEEVTIETEMVLDLISDYDVTYPVVFDWEFISEDNARTDNVSGEEITEMAIYFCEQVKEAGYIPSIYFNTDMAYRFLDLSALKEYPFWLAELTANPRFYYHFDMWQYTFTGSVPGIFGDVDLNLSFRDFAKETAALRN